MSGQALFKGRIRGGLKRQDISRSQDAIDGRESRSNYDALGDKNKCIQSGVLGTGPTLGIYWPQQCVGTINFVAGALPFVFVRKVALCSGSAALQPQSD